MRPRCYEAGKKWPSTCKIVQLQDELGLSFNRVRDIAEDVQYKNVNIQIIDLMMPLGSAPSTNGQEPIVK